MLINEIRKIPKDNIICNAKCVILRKIYKHQDQVTTFYNITFESKDVSWLSNYEKEIITQHFIKELLHPFEELKWKAIQKITGLTIPAEREFRCVQ